MPTKQADPTMTLRMHMLRNARAGPFNASIEAAQCLCITGASGSGKSVLLRMLADIDPAEGELSLAGMDRRAMPASTWRQRVMLVPAQAGWWAPTVACTPSVPASTAPADRPGTPHMHHR